MTSLEGNCGVWSRKVNACAISVEETIIILNFQSLQPSTTDFHLRVVVSFSYEHLTEEDKIYDLTCSYTSRNISIGAYYDTVYVLRLFVCYNYILFAFFVRFSEFMYGYC